MTISLRPVDDCIITILDVNMFAAYENKKEFMDYPLISVSLQKKDGEILSFHDICDLEVF